MSLHTFGKTGTALATVIVTVFAGLVAMGPSAGAATALADCTARLDPRAWSWTAQCAAPHTVSIRTQAQWYWLSSPTVIYNSTWTHSHEVVPGTPWNEGVYPLPGQMIIQRCLTAYQDSTLQIAPRVCYYRW